MDGIIWAVPEIGDNRRWITAKQLGQLPPIVFLSMAPCPDLSIVAVDNRAGAKLVVQHLIKQGCRQVGIITGPLTWWEARERVEGWKEALDAAGLSHDDALVAHGDWSSASGERGMETLLARTPHLDALFASNDQMALGALSIVFLHAPQRRPGLLGRLGIVDAKARQRATQELLKQIGGIVSPDQRVADLSIAQQQLTEIVKALAQDARIIVMDEPTSVLPGHEVELLFQLIRRLKERGIAVVFVSHRLEETRRIADRVTVLRDGQKVGLAEVDQVTDDDIISMMVGRTIENLYPRTEQVKGQSILKVTGLARKGVLNNVSFELRRGEILGLAGLVGAGRSEIARCIFGADAFDSGVIELEGQPVTIHSPQDAVKAGIGYVPEDRKLQGLILGMSVRDNIALAVLRQLARRGLVPWRVVDRLGKAYVDQLQLRPPRIDLPVQQLSGGNQQKVVLAKWLALKPRLLILDEPTRGIDIGAKAEVHELMDRLVNEGVGIILISSELPEILYMSDRLLVVAEGEIVGELSRAEATQERVLELASGKG